MPNFQSHKLLSTGEGSYFSKAANSHEPFFFFDELTAMNLDY